jgi:hypothetical protein
MDTDLPIRGVPFMRFRARTRAQIRDAQIVRLAAHRTPRSPWGRHTEPAICRRSAIVTGARQSWRSARCTLAPKVSQNVRETGQRHCPLRQPRFARPQPMSASAVIGVVVGPAKPALCPYVWWG